MANNYTLFSEYIPEDGQNGLSEEEEAWVEDRLQHLEHFLDNIESSEPGDEAWEGRAELGFSWEIQDDGKRARRLWAYAEEGGDPDGLALFVREFLAKFRPRDCFWFCWCSFCDKPRVGEFKGGAHFVTAEGITEVSPSHVCLTLKQEYQARLAGLPPPPPGGP